jgi:hypothetical protein
MDIIRNRLPSTRNMILVFSVCAFPVFVWSILHLLYQVPGWLIQLNTWDLIGFIAYTQAFALIETLIIFILLVLLSVILPAQLLRAKFAAQASMIILLSSAWSIFLFYNSEIIYKATRVRLFWLALCLASIGAIYVLIQRYTKLETRICSILGRLQPLSLIYIAMGFLSLIIVLVRNV